MFEHLLSVLARRDHVSDAERGLSLTGEAEAEAAAA